MTYTWYNSDMELGRPLTTTISISGMSMP